MIRRQIGFRARAQSAFSEGLLKSFEVLLILFGVALCVLEQRVSMMAYVRVLGALECEFEVIPAAMPTLEVLGELF